MMKELGTVEESMQPHGEQASGKPWLRSAPSNGCCSYYQKAHGGNDHPCEDVGGPSDNDH